MRKLAVMPLLVTLSPISLLVLLLLFPLPPFPQAQQTATLNGIPNQSVGGAASLTSLTVTNGTETVIIAPTGITTTQAITAGTGLFSSLLTVGSIQNGVPGNPIYVTEAGEGAVTLDVEGGLEITNVLTSPNCASAASPAVCAAAVAGSVAVPTGGTTLVVNTSAVTTSSQVLLTFDSSLGTRLGVTCNTSVNQPTVSARSAGVSFTVTMASTVNTNPACLGFLVVN